MNYAGSRILESNVTSDEWAECVRRLYEYNDNGYFENVCERCFDDKGSFIDFTYEDFVWFFGFVKGVSTPGAPWMQMSMASNKAVYENSALFLYESVCEVLHALLDSSKSNFNSLVFNTVLRYFPKNETLGDEKVEAKACRLICNLPLHVLIAELVLLKGILDFFVVHHNERVHKPGMGLHDEGLDDLCRWFLSFCDLISTDVSNFDFNVHLKMLKAKVDYYLKLHGYPRGCDWHRMAKRFERLVSEAPFMMPDGKVFLRHGTKLYRKVQVTGREDTANGNSVCRSLLDFLPSIRAFIESMPVSVMGDDDVASTSDKATYLRVLLEAGVLIKLESLAKDSIASFCSHDFYANGYAIPQNIAKNTASLLGSQPTAERYLAYRFTNRHHPLRAEFLAAVDESGWTNAALGYVPSVGDGILV
jgi:hypothetical protein